MRNSTAGIILLALGSLVVAGCPSANVYRTGRVLDKGVSDFGLTFTAMRVTGSDYTVENSDGTTEKVDAPDYVLPNLIPDLSFHIGVDDDVEVGGRIGLGSLLLELDAKYRFLHTPEGLHLAVQPALGYQTAFILEGFKLTLPIIMTYELNDTIGLNLYGIGAYRSMQETDEAFNGLGFEGFEAGGGIGIDIRGDTFYFMPGVEVTKYIADMSDSVISGSIDTTYVMIGISFGWYGGKELKKLKKMDKKLDRMDDKLDRIGDTLDKD